MIFRRCAPFCSIHSRLARLHSHTRWWLKKSTHSQWLTALQIGSSQAGKDRQPCADIRGLWCIRNYAWQELTFSKHVSLKIFFFFLKLAFFQPVKTKTNKQTQIKIKDFVLKWSVDFIFKSVFYLCQWEFVKLDAELHGTVQCHCWLPAVSLILFLWWQEHATFMPNSNTKKVACATWAN